MSDNLKDMICVNDDVRYFISEVAAKIYTSLGTKEEQDFCSPYMYPSILSSRKSLNEFCKFLLRNNYFDDATILIPKLKRLYNENEVSLENFKNKYKISYTTS